MLKDTNYLHNYLLSNLRHQKHMIPFVCSQAFNVLNASKSQLLQQKQKAYTERFIYESIETETNVDRFVWVLFNALGASEIFVSRGALLVCFCYMLLTNTVKFHLEKIFSVPEKSVGEELSDELLMWSSCLLHPEDDCYFS